MSPTRHLENPSSPARRWFAEQLPHTGAVAKDANHVLRGSANQREGQIAVLGRAKEPPLPCRATNHALASSALDLLAQAVLRSSALEWIAARECAGRVVVGPGIPPAMSIERAAVARIEAMRPWEPSSPRTGGANSRSWGLGTIGTEFGAKDSATLSYRHETTSG